MNARQNPASDHAASELDEIPAEEGIRQGLEDERAGRLQPVREFFAEFEAPHNIRETRRHALLEPRGQAEGD
jgi:hypothetical protein